jgi:hypothetical protein
VDSYIAEAVFRLNCAAMDKVGVPRGVFSRFLHQLRID